MEMGNEGIASLCLFGLAFLGCLPREAHVVAMPPTKDLRDVAEGSDKFALDLYMDNQSSLVVSPLGIRIVSAILAGGAQGNTLAELIKVMHFPEDQKILRSGYKQIIQHLQAPQLKMANNVFLEESLQIKSDFIKEVLDYYLTEIVPVPFSSDPVSSAKKINDWAMEKTNGEIKDIVTESDAGGIDLLLANAIYFKAKWKYTFQECNTTEQYFFTSKVSRVMVQMMEITGSFRYAHLPDQGLKVLELPYEGDKFRMVIILPDEIEGLPQVEKRLYESGSYDVIDLIWEENVNVKLPRFKIDSTMNLVEPLEQLGLNDIFTRDCNLSGMFHSGRVRVERVVQKSFIEVNEEGTEAACTSVSHVRPVKLYDPIPPTYSFIVNRPFLAMILPMTGSIPVLFARLARNFQ